MTGLTIQCPTCGLHLVHSERIISRVEGRRGATRCTRCRDRIHFDATSGVLRISFPDLLDETLDDAAKHSVPPAPTETVDPPTVVSEQSFEERSFEEQGSPIRRVSEVVVRTPSELPPAVVPTNLSQPPLPADLEATRADGEPVFLLLPSKRVG